MSRPIGNGGANRINERRDRCGFHPERPPDLVHMLPARSTPLSSDGEMVLAAGTVGKADVVGRRQAPAASGVHQEGVVLQVIIPVVGEDVEGHPAEHFVLISSVPGGPAHQLQQVCVVDGRLAEVDVEQAGGGDRDG